MGNISDINQYPWVTQPQTGYGVPVTPPQAQQPQTQNSNPLLGFLGSPGGSSLISGILGGIGAVGQGKRDERMNQQQLALQQQQLGMQGRQNNMQDMLTRDLAYSQQAPTGWAQNYEQQNLLKNIMLQKLLAGPSMVPQNPAIASKVGSGFTPTIPDEWKNVNPFGADQTAQSLAQRQGALDLLSGGRGPGMDFAALGYSPETAGKLNQQTTDYRNFTGQQYSNTLNDAINMSRNPLAQGAGGGGGQQQGGGGGFGMAQAAGLGLAAAPAVMGMLNKGGGASFATPGGSGASAPLAGGQSAMGLANSIAGPATLGLGLAANYLPQGAPQGAARGAALGGQIGSFIPGVGTAIGAGVGAISGAIKGHQNQTGGQREDFARQLGYGNLDGLYNQLNQVGPQGQQLTQQGLNVIGRHDTNANNQWMQLVQQLLNGQGQGGNGGGQQFAPQYQNPYARVA